LRLSADDEGGESERPSTEEIAQAKRDYVNRLEPGPIRDALAGALVPSTDQASNACAQLVALPMAQPPSPQSATPEPFAYDLIAAQREAVIIRTMAAGVTLGVITGQQFGGLAGSMPGAQAYRDDLIARAGAPADPLEEMLVEQFAMLHLQMLLTHRKAAAATGNEVTRLLCGGVARLSSESRRLALAIRSYRSGPTKSSVVVNQTGNAGGKQVAVVVQGRRAKKDPLAKNAKQASKQLGAT
jgi:hypothetical protein